MFPLCFQDFFSSNFDTFTHTGVVITDMDWDMEIQGEVKSGQADSLAFNMDVDSLVNSGSVEGDTLWRVGLYGSTNPRGSGKKLNLQRQILSQDQSGRSLRAGETMEVPFIESKFDLTEVGCEEEYQYLCLEFTKGERARPDFMFEVQQGGDEIVRCKKQPCRKGRTIFLSILICLAKNHAQCLKVVL